MSVQPGRGARRCGRGTFASLAILGIIALVLCATQPGEASRLGALRYTNPVFKRDFPDPTVLRLGRHDYYAYGTTASWETGYFPILHSSDLVHWRYVADAFKNFPTWSSGDFWAPDVVKRGNTYYFYYVGHGGPGHCIGVATGRSPKGPFKHRAIVGCGGANGIGWIDPDLFIDRDGKIYLYVSVDDPEHTISVVPMKPDLITAAGPAQRLFGLSQPWEHGAKFSTVEGPFLIRHGSLYYLFYSGNDYNGSYAMGYATSGSPTGPFTKYAGNPILHGNKHVVGPGGGSVVQGPDGNLWMVYHAWSGREGYENGGARTMRIDPLVWHGDAVTVPAHPG